MNREVALMYFHMSVLMKISALAESRDLASPEGDNAKIGRKTQ